MKTKRLVACLLFLCVFTSLLVGSASALELAEGV